MRFNQRSSARHPGGGRLQIGIGGRLGSEQVADFKSESVADLRRNPHVSLRQSEHAGLLRNSNSNSRDRISTVAGGQRSGKSRNLNDEIFGSLPR